MVSESGVAGNERIVEVLHALVTRPDATGVRELALALGASRSTVNRVLLGLEEHGLAAVSGNGNYQVGPRLRVLGAALHARHPLLRSAEAIIERLGEQSDATVLIAVHDAPRPSAVVVACRRRPGPIKYLLEPGTVLPLHAGATGRSILGRLGIGALGERQLEAHTPDTVTERAELERLTTPPTPSARPRTGVRMTGVRNGVRSRWSRYSAERGVDPPGPELMYPC